MQRPWNIIDLPVYSLATMCNERLNMNICTYVQVVSMEPKQYMIALHPDSQSAANLQQAGQGVLQLLNSDQISLVQPFGFTSGTTVHKIDMITDHIVADSDFYTPYLQNTVAVLNLTVVNCTKGTGDHWLFICAVDNSKILHNKTVLTTTLLKENNLLP